MQRYREEMYMPIYVYEVTVPGVESASVGTVEVLRNFAEYDVPPTAEEAIAAGLTTEEAASAIYRKVLGRGIQLVKGANWGPGKGFW